MCMVTECSYGSMTRQNTRLSGDGHERELSPWHDAPLPRNLEKTDKKVPLETDDADDHPEEDTLQKDQNVDYVVNFAAFTG